MPVAASTTVPAKLRTALLAGALVVVSACGSPAVQGLAPGAQEDTAARALAEQVKDSAAMVHLQALQRIADEHGGNRASGTPGYDASVDYVVGVLKDAGFDVTTPTYQSSGDNSDEDSDENSGNSGGRGTLTSRNVIAQTRSGDPAHVVMIGAHLDSVPQGPGVVDDGSGVATVLEIASRLGPSSPVRNAVRFAFFGSEETDLGGSKSYVQSLSAADRQKVMLYLNVDMVASPNAGYFVQGGTGEARSETGPPGSDAVARVLADQLKATGVTPERLEFAGDDETPFIKAGIPTGGAENGDKEEKSSEQAQAWGGRSDEVYDRCYHSACDSLSNVNRDVLNHYLRAVAGTVGHFAATSSPPAR